jgi:hypothetical protein
MRQDGHHRVELGERLRSRIMGLEQGCEDNEAIALRRLRLRIHQPVNLGQRRSAVGLAPDKANLHQIVSGIHAGAPAPEANVCVS